MKIFVLDGCKQDYDNVKVNLNAELAMRGHQVEWFKVKDKEIQYCVGCWTCWTKTPGKCIHNDDTTPLLEGVINSDFFIHLTENSLGFNTSLSKKAHDKLVALLHPHIELVNGECHHVMRYEKVPNMGLIYIDTSNNPSDYSLVKEVTERQALNLRNKLKFSEHITNVEEVRFENLML